MSMDEITQVYVVTYGSYSDYGIGSIWLTLEEAEAEKGERIEVWPIGTNQRTLGSFYRYGQVDILTHKVDDQMPFDSPDIPETEHVSVLIWPNDKGVSANKLGLRVTGSTQEQANKVYSEVRARVLAELSMGLPPESIADHKYDPSVPSRWVKTQRNV